MPSDFRSPPSHASAARRARVAPQQATFREDPWRLAIEKTGVGTWIHDQLTGELAWSRQSRLIFDVEPERAVSFGLFLSCVHPEDRESVEREYGSSLRPEGPRKFHQEFRLKCPGGTRWALVRCRLIFEQADEAVVTSRMVGIVMDVTEQCRAERSRRMADLYEYFRSVAGGVAHNFNNLLTGALGNASLLETTLPRGSFEAACAERVVQASERMARLTAQLLASAGGGTGPLQRLRLSRHVNETIALMQSGIPKAIHLRLPQDQDRVVIRADPNQVRQLVLNVVTNGVEAIGPERPGEIEIQTGIAKVEEQDLLEERAMHQAPAGEYAVLCVKDSGCGMDPAVQHHIFDPFFTTKFTGRGLGLAEVEGIVRAHHGFVAVNSKPSAGTTLRVYFPVASGG